MADKNLFIYGQSLKLELLQQLQQKPAPFTPGESLFWDDQHISAQMLKAHLNPHIDAASYRPETIDRCVAWLMDELALPAGTAVLDLGCGPGLYATRLAQRDCRVTGIDISRRSIDYATRYAHEHHLDIIYRYQDYLSLNDKSQYDIALLISGDFCPLAPAQRARLLNNVHRALKAGGYFVLDVTTRAHQKRRRGQNIWYAVDSGFWRPGPHLVLEQVFDYPEHDVHLNQYIIIEADGTLYVYRNWFQSFTPETIRSELERGGFSVRHLQGDLTGQPYSEGSEWIGVVAQKKTSEVSKTSEV